MFYEPHTRDFTRLPHDPFKAVVGPRPIAWISTLDRNGIANLAPYSYFNIAAIQPPMLMFSSIGLKHTVTNALEQGEFVVNVATAALAQAVNATSDEVSSDISEFSYAGLTPQNCRLVAPPRVAESPVSFECRVTQHIDVVDSEQSDVGSRVVFGEVVGVHIDEAYLTDEGLLDIAAMRIIGKIGYRNDFSAVDRLFWPGEDDLVDVATR